MIGLNLKFWTVVLILLLQQGCSEGLYKFAALSKERGALCLDGSPAGLYYHIGSEANKNKFLIYFNGGDFCKGLTVADTLQSCYKRSKTNLGSTEKAAQTINADNYGLLSTLRQNNPVFYDWTKVLMIYCDGSEYTGSRLDPISYKDRKLYFRGHNNTLEQLRYMDEQFDFYNSEKIVITGVSAGGIATYLYSNYVMENTKTAKVYAIPDSGLFITEFYSPIVSFQPIKLFAENLFKIVLYQNNGFPITECVQQIGVQNIYLCYNAGNLAKHLKAPILMIESPYDQYSLKNIVVVDCISNPTIPYSIQTCTQNTMGIIQDYRKQTIKAMMKIKGNRTDVGTWSPSCVQHGFSAGSSFTDSRYKVPSGSGKMVFEAIEQFLQNPNKAPWYFDEVGWPHNTGCNGLKHTHLIAQ